MKPKTDKQKGLLLSIGGLFATALPYLPQVAQGLATMGVNPKAVSVLTAAGLIYQAFKTDPAKKSAEAAGADG